MLAMASPSLADVVVKDQRPAGQQLGQQYREVRFGDLNLDSQEGMNRLNTRIAVAVRNVCGQADNRVLQQVAFVRDCRNESLARAFADRDAIVAARLAARGQPERVAAVTTSISIARPAR